MWTFTSEVSGRRWAAAAAIALVAFAALAAVGLAPKRLWLMRKSVFGVGSAQVLLTGAIIGAIALMIKTLIVDEPVSGWATLFVSMWFIAGVMIMIMGIIAVYIGSIFNEVKHRPSYIIDEMLNG